jgi:hypothetical protein
MQNSNKFSDLLYSIDYGNLDTVNKFCWSAYYNIYISMYDT